MANRAESIKDYLKEDEAFNRYLGELWADLRQWLKQDINADDSRVKQRIAHAGQWFGETLIADDALRASLNGHLEQAAHRVAPEFAAFLTRHISDTVKSWDARDMSRQIELNIGKDLQFIRVNGTLVGDDRAGLIPVIATSLTAARTVHFLRRKMADITLSLAQRDGLRDALRDYCRDHFELELEQFDAEFFIDFISEKLGPVYYNAGIEEAIRTHLAWSERIQEEMDLKKIL